MKMFERDLKSILEKDPLGILDITPKKSNVISNDERLVKSFLEINHFYEEHGREPIQSEDILERKLFSRLKGVRNDESKIESLLEYDKWNLLKESRAKYKPEVNSVDDILDNDPLGVLKEKNKKEEEIFKIIHVPEKKGQPDYYANRKPCKDFRKFESLFKQCQIDLMRGNRRIRPFKKEQQIEKGHFFILKNIMVYIADVGKKEEIKGKVNARLRCIFENGTESDMLLRSLATGLYKDKDGKRITDHKDRKLNRPLPVTEEDKETGFLYIAKSKSERKEISEIKNLYKIGFSTKPAGERIKNAKKEPSYLMSEASIVSEFQCFNMNTQKLELFLHRFFSSACLNIDIYDSHGKRFSPREWFVVPLPAIEEAIHLLIKGEIINYKFDEKESKIIRKS